MKAQKLLLLLGFCVAAIGGGSKQAHSDVQPAMAGHGWPNHFDTCFSSSWAMMVNNCAATPGDTRLLVIPYQTTSSATYAASAMAGGNGSDGKTTCQAIAITSAGTSYGFSSRVQTSTSTAIQPLSLGSISVNSGGTIHFECDVAEGGGRVVNVRLN